MEATITRVERVDYFDSDEPGAVIRIRATLDTPIKRPAERAYDADEVTVIRFEVFSNDEYEFKPLRPGTTWLIPYGYVLTKRGARNKTHGFGRLRRDLSPTEEVAVIQSLQRSERLPEVLRDRLMPSTEDEHCDECGAPVPVEANEHVGDWHDTACSLHAENVVA